MRAIAAAGSPAPAADTCTAPARASCQPQYAITTPAASASAASSGSDGRACASARRGGVHRVAIIDPPRASATRRVNPRLRSCSPTRSNGCARCSPDVVAESDASARSTCRSASRDIRRRSSCSMRSPQGGDGTRELSHDGRQRPRCARRSPDGSRAATRCARSIRRRRCCRCSAAAKRCSRSRRRSSTAAAPARRWSCPIRSTRSTKARRCSPARRRLLRQRRCRHAASRTTWRCSARRRLGAHAAAVRVLARQSDRPRARPSTNGSELFALSDRHGFVIASDECYSEIYFDEAQPPLGALAAAQACGRDGYPRLVVFGSLSKRSNAPGLRSGYVAGDAALLKAFLLYRTYHGSRDVGRRRRGEHRRMERRGARARQPRRIRGEVRARCSRGSRRRCRARCPRRRSTCGRRRPATTPRSRGGCYAEENVAVLPGKLPRPRRARRAIPAPDASASRSSPTPRRVRRGDRADRRLCTRAASARTSAHPAPATRFVAAGSVLSAGPMRRGRGLPRMPPMATHPALPRRRDPLARRLSASMR